MKTERSGRTLLFVCRFSFLLRFVFLRIALSVPSGQLSQRASQVGAVQKTNAVLVSPERTERIYKTDRGLDSRMIIRIHKMTSANPA